MTMDRETVWIVILALGAGSFLLRFSFLGLIGGRPMPEWLLRHLRYTAVAVLPGLVAPLVLWPAATGGMPDVARILAACTTLAVGYWRRNVIWAMLAGAVTLYTLLAITG
jgi:branched-subunit amino acid transport protein